MLAIVFAMIVLQNADPTPVTTPAASLGTRLTGSAPATGLQGLDTSSPFGDVSVTVGCTYGTPRLGPSLLADANDLTRSSTMPNCVDPAGQSLQLPLGSAYPAFFTAPRYGSTFASSLEHVPTTFSMVRRAERSFAITHLIVPTEFSGGAGSATGSSFHATTTAAHATAPSVHRPVAATHQL